MAEAGAVASQAEQKIKLKLYYGGSFVKDAETGTDWRYVGGSVFNDAIPHGFKFADVIERFCFKLGCPISIKYQTPGEELDPEALVAVADDDDLQELYEEYFSALNRPGTPLKTFRLKIWLFPALVFETAVYTEDMEASMCEAERPLNPESWCSEDLSYSSNPSCNPSSDTEVQLMLAQQQASAKAAASAAVAGQHGQGLQQRFSAAAAAAQGSDAPKASVQAAVQQPAGAAGVLGARPSEAEQQQQQQEHPAADWLPARLEHHALSNLTRSVQARHFSNSGAGALGFAGAGPSTAQHHFRQHDFFTAEDFDLDDPYDDDQPLLGGKAKAKAQPAGAAASPADQQAQGLQQQLQQQTNEAGQAREQWKDWPNNNMKGEPLSNRPLERVRDAASGLPSHISAFGDSSHGSGGAGGGGGLGLGLGLGGAAPVSQPGSVRLPSHISAFGEGLDDEAAASAGLEGVAREAREAERLRMQQLYGGNLPIGVAPVGVDGLGLGGARGSKCITQEFAALGGSSLLLRAGDGDGPLGPLDFNFAPGQGMEEALPTPKLLLDSVPHVPRAQVVITNKIGEGAFGEVSRAEVFPYGTVAIKWLKRDRFAKYSESFQREAEVLARLNHPNIIRMFGLVTEPADGSGSGAPSGPSSSALLGAAAGAGVAGGLGPGPLGTPGGSGVTVAGGHSVAGIMMEYVRGGSLAQRFRALAAAGRRLPLRERCRVALQAALGMAYLHDQQPAVIHFDLKPDNLLVEGEGEDTLVKVADFGLSKHKFQNYVTCHDLRGTLPYMAPELVANPTKVCEKCDVWSMGVVMWEMVTLEVPFQELSAQSILMGLMQGRLHLRVPPGCETEWRDLIEACMEPNPAHRPTFKDLATRLEELGRALAAAQAQAAAVQAQAHAAALQHAQAVAAAQAQAQAQAAAVAAAMQQQAAVAAMQQHQQQQQHLAVAAALVHQPHPQQLLQLPLQLYP